MSKGKAPAYETPAGPVASSSPAKHGKGELPERTTPFKIGEVFEDIARYRIDRALGSVITPNFIRGWMRVYKDQTVLEECKKVEEMLWKMSKRPPTAVRLGDLWQRSKRGAKPDAFLRKGRP